MRIFTHASFWLAFAAALLAYTAGAFGGAHMARGTLTRSRVWQERVAFIVVAVLVTLAGAL